MKQTRRLLAFVMAALLALPLLCATAWAEDAAADTYTFVVDNQTEGYEYALYQMFTGDTAENPEATGEDDKYILSNVEWGYSVLPETQEAMYDMFELTGDDRNAVKVAEAIAASTDSDIFHTMMNYMADRGKTGGASLQHYKYLSGPSDFDVNGETKTGYGADGLPSGYYLVRNTAVPAGDRTATYSDYIIEVAGEDVFAATKVATTGTVKKVQDINDSTDDGLSALKDSADYDIGDTIPYTLTATLPQNYDAYDGLGYYNLKFEDDMCSGLTWDGSAIIYYGADDQKGQTIQFGEVTNQTIAHDGITEQVKSAYEDGTVWMYDCGNLKETHPELKPGDMIRVEYTATLNSHALVGSTGNKNQHRIIYSSNPTDRDQLNASNFDLNIVFTYKTVFNKLNEEGEALKGADFKLEKYIKKDNAWVDVTALHTGTDAENPAKDGTTAGSSFSFSGLGDGKYRLTEVTTPAGYNTLEPQEFEISATHTEGDAPELTELSGTDGAEFVMEANLPLATLSANITNRPGVVLPASGSQGTKYLSIAGAVLVAASVAIVTRQRRRAAA